jgi:hypothetical protein
VSKQAVPMLMSFASFGFAAWILEFHGMQYAALRPHASIFLKILAPHAGLAFCASLVLGVLCVGVCLGRIGQNRQSVATAD